MCYTCLAKSILCRLLCTKTLQFTVVQVVSQVAANPGYDLDLGMCTSFASFIFLCLTTLIILHSPTAGDIRMIGLFNISEE